MYIYILLLFVVFVFCIVFFYPPPIHIALLLLSYLDRVIPRAILYEVVCILKTNCGYQLTRSIDETSFVVANVKVC